MIFLISLFLLAISASSMLIVLVLLLACFERYIKAKLAGKAHEKDDVERTGGKLARVFIVICIAAAFCSGFLAARGLS